MTIFGVKKRATFYSGRRRGDSFVGPTQVGLCEVCSRGMEGTYGAREDKR